MTEHKERKGARKAWYYIFLMTWCAQMILAVYFCTQKQGFHEDEYYSYYSTARTYGLFVEDGKWKEYDDYFQEFTVLEGQGFQYGLVRLVQSWDVHPPVYYWVLHTICSFFPGQFSKWFGLVINLAAFGVSLFLLWDLSMEITKRKEKLSFLICFFYGFTPAVMSSVVFIRMYALLTVFVYLCAILHIRVMARGEETLSIRKFLLPLAVVTYLGFLTQYYYFIFLFFMAAAFGVWLLFREQKIDRKRKNCFLYGISLGVAFLLAYVTYPSCLGQMFRGQRGAQATGNFFDMSNTFSRICFFGKLLNEFVFGKVLYVLLATILLLTIYIIARKRQLFPAKTLMKTLIKKYATYWALLFTVIGYFLVVSKTGLLLGETSIRYQAPVYGMVVLLVFMALWELGRKCLGNVDSNRGKWLLAVAAAVCLLVNCAGLLSGRVVFLYPEDEERVAFARERAAAGTPVLYLYDEGQSWCVWDSANEFFEYNKIYFASLYDTEPITDDVIAGCDDLVVYLSNSADTDAEIQRIMDSNPKLTAYELQYQEKYCDVYYFK